ncbi:molecular chaperone [Mycobacterium sp. IS-1742]|uniref:Hsp70 family protein n=1 Tax=Mycobacterium sp. IS-1742 TaxID=1772285 RepID=UPI0007404B9D|nr:Hsp70 family protein [Mycobacterium sp. IS-1742]KUI28537.1 molecular chaperone [Mycobacterium sp. IS-1742]
MRTSLGVSLGAANLVAVADGRPIIRPAVLTLGGSTITGFVDRVGDPVPLIAPDGSAHYGGQLAAAAIEAITRAAHPYRRPDSVAVAVPAHWSPTAVAALSAVIPQSTVVSDAVAALTALQANPGLPARGVVALCDFGASGTGITLADAGDGFRVIGETVRYDDFSGDLIDQAVLQHVLADLEVDPSGTSAVASLQALREESRAAKERLSVQTATALTGPHANVRLTRPELDSLLAGPLAGFVDTVIDVLHRNGVVPAQLAAVATVGGGARIPLVTQRLSEALRLPVITGPYAQVAAAAGAQLLASRGGELEAVTTIAPVPDAFVSDAPATEAAIPLAWSAETVDFDAATQYVQPVYDAAMARPGMHFDQAPVEEAPDGSPWFRKPGALFAGAACLAALAATGLILTSQTGDAEAVQAGASGITAPVATQPIDQPAQPVEAPQQGAPAPAVTERVAAAAPRPAPRAVRPPSQPSPNSAAERRVASKQVAPRPAAPAPAPAPRAPVPAAPPAPAPSMGLPRLPLPAFTPRPAPSPPCSAPAPSQPAPSPEPAPEPEPTQEPAPQPEPTQEPAPQPEPEPAPEPEPTAAPQPTQEPAPQPSAEPTVEPAPSECVPDAETVC